MSVYFIQLLKFFLIFSFRIGETPLIYAVKGRHTELVQLLLESGADISIKSREGSALDFSPSEEITEILQKYSSKKLKKTNLNSFIFIKKQFIRREEKSKCCKNSITKTYCTKKFIRSSITS